MWGTRENDKQININNILYDKKQIYASGDENVKTFFFIVKN